MLKLNNIFEAKKRIKNYVIKTPLIYSQVISKILNLNIYFKCEFLQPVGSFKIRGVANKVLSEIEKGNFPKTITTGTSGNHGIALAYIGNMINAKSVIFVPKIKISYKINLMKLYNAEVKIKGKYSDEAAYYALKFSKEKNAFFIHSYDDLKIIEGHATVGLEINEQINDAKYVIVPVGGGALVSGISFVLKNLNPKIKIIGVQSKNAPSLYKSLKEKKIVKLRKTNTIAEGISVREVGKFAFEICKNYLDEVFLVSDKDILKALKLIFEKERILIEPTAAASLACVLKRKFEEKSKIVLVLTGKNISNEFLKNLLFFR